MTGSLVAAFPHLEPVTGIPGAAMPSIRIREVLSAELEIRFRRLAELLDEAVRGGASLGFLPPLRSDEARQYWLSLRPELQRGSRILLGAWYGNRLVGAGQLSLPPLPSARHRAEVQKLLVGADFRGRGIGRALMTALHEAALQRGRSLVLLNARRGDAAERFYRKLGYQEGGVVPGYTVGPWGERYDSVSFYMDLRRSSHSTK